MGRSSHTNIKNTKRRSLPLRRFRLSKALENKGYTGLSFLFLEGLMVIAMAYFIAQLIWSVTVPSRLDPVNISNISVNPGAFSSRQSDYSGLLSYNPFGGTTVVNDTINSNSFDAPETSLNLTLAGIRQSPDGGAAIIRTPDNRQALYNIGDEIVSGVRLTGVEPGRAILSRNGALESLSLNPERGSSIVTATAEEIATGSANAIADVLSNIQLIPYRVDRRIEGFEIGHESNPALLAGAGLEVGDIILEINDIALLSMERVEELPADLAAASQLDMYIMRDGRTQSIIVSIG